VPPLGGFPLPTPPTWPPRYKTILTIFATMCSKQWTYVDPPKVLFFI
jgi:hypothetical protein